MMQFFRTDKIEGESKTYCIGNGKVAGYFQGANILQLFGPCYSIPSVMSLLCNETNCTSKVSHEEKAPIYTTELYRQNSKIGTIEDFTHENEPAFIRKLDLSVPLEFEIKNQFLLKENNFSNSKFLSFLIRVDQGQSIFSKCRTDFELFCCAMFSANTVIKGSKVKFPAGKSWFIFTAGESGESKIKSFKNCMRLSQDVAEWDLDLIKNDTRKRWKDYFKNVKDFTSIVKGSRFEVDVLQAIDETVIALKTQTSEQGGVLAGEFYHLAYGRDMYGVIRGYLELGLNEEAKNCIKFFINSYRNKGLIANGNGMGISCSHCHENDEVEQTGYHLCELIEYIKCSGDVDFIKENIDYVKYLILAQEKNLYKNMLPFNGDETYIAGGLLPRQCIDHGSMESTALYIVGMEQFLGIANQEGFFEKEWLDEREKKLEQVKAAYADCFIKKDKIYLNNPERADKDILPEFRHGVCQGCNVIDWLKKTENGGYLCLECYGKTATYIDQNRYSLDCALFMPVFVGARLLPKDLLRQKITEALQEKRKNDYDANSCKNVVGYDYGLLLYVLSLVKPEEDADDVLDALMRQRAETGVWVEYNLNGKAGEACCPYRPWESAINLSGILHYLKEKNKNIS